MTIIQTSGDSSEARTLITSNCANSVILSNSVARYDFQKYISMFLNTNIVIPPPAQSSERRPKLTVKGSLSSALLLSALDGSAAVLISVVWCTDKSSQFIYKHLKPTKGHQSAVQHLTNESKPS